MLRTPESKTLFWRSSWCGGRGCWSCCSRIRFMGISLRRLHTAWCQEPSGRKDGRLPTTLRLRAEGGTKKHSQLLFFSRPSLPGLHLLTVASDNVSLVSVDGISVGAATHHVLDGRDVPRLEDILATPPVEAIHRGVTGSAHKVVPSNATVD